MATSIGSLILELRLDPSAFNRDLSAAKAQAQSASNLFGKQFTLTPKVDHRPLAELNKHLDRKQQHWTETRRDFAKPLVPSIDLRRVNQANAELNKLQQTVRGLQRNGTISVNATVNARYSATGGSGGQSTGDLADAIGRAVAKHSRPSMIGSVLSSPFKALGFGVTELLRGGLIDVGANLSRGLGFSGGSRKAGQKTSEYARKINQYLIGVEDVMAGFVAEITRSGDFSKAASVATSRARFNKHAQKLQKMQQLATWADDVEQVKNIPELVQLIPQEKRAEFNADPKAFLSKNRKIASSMATRSQELIQELNPQELIQDLINPLLSDLGGVTGFIGKVQANRAIIEAQNRRKNATRPLLPNLEEGQQGYVNMIGGAQFRGGQGYRQLDAAFEAMFPDRRILGVANPDTDPGGEPTGPLAKFLFEKFKQIAPDMAKNQEMSNTIANAVTMLGAALDPMYKSEAVSQALGNILAAQEAGVDPSKVSTVSYSLGGMEAEAVARALEILDMKESKVLAMAYPGLNFRGKNPENFKSTLIEEDPLGFAKNVLNLGTDQTHSTYQTGVPSSASAHAYQHYFKNPQQVADFYDFLGIEARPQAADAKSLGKFLGNASSYYESVGSMMQVQSLAQTGKLDPTLPVQSFQHSDNVTGSAVIAKFLESAYTMKLPTGNLSPEQQAIQTKFQEKLQATFKMLIDAMIAAGEDISPDITPADLYGRIKYDEELRKYNANIQAFQTGQINDDSWFAGDFDPIKVQQRFADLDKGEAFFSDPNIMPQGSAYRDKMLLLFKNLRTVMTEFVETGKVSEQTLAQIQQIEPEKFSDAFLAMARQTMDDTKSPGIESTRRFQRPAPDWAYENPASIVAYNKMVEDVGSKGYVPPLDQIKAAAYGMSGASAFITDEFVYKNDVGDASKIASDQEVRAYKRLAGRYAPLLYEADPGKALVTERIKGTPVKELLDQAAKPAKAARKRLEKLQADLAEVNAEIARADEDADTSDLKAKQSKLVDRIRKQSEAFLRTRLNFNNYAEGLYEQIGQLGATLQSMGVAHNDLASGNVFVTDEGVKAIDLGNAVVNPTGMQKFQDQATTVQRAIIDRDYYGILDPMRATRAITRGYSMGAMPLPEKRKASVADLPQYENVEPMPLGTDADTFLEQALGYQELVPQMREQVAARDARRQQEAMAEAERKRQKLEEEAARRTAEIEQSQHELIGDMGKRVRRRRALNAPTIGPVTNQGLAAYSDMPADLGDRLQRAASGLPIVNQSGNIPTAEPVNIPLSLPERDPSAIELSKPSGGIVQRASSAVGGAIVSAVENVAGKIKEGIEDYAVGRINTVLMRVPGQPNTLDPSRQIGGLDELDLSDLFKASLIGIEDVSRGTLQTLVQTYSMAKGVESAVFKAVPLIGAIGSVGKNVVMPLAIGAGVTQLPGIGGAMAGTETLLADTLGNLLAGTGIGAVEMAGGAAGGFIAEATTMIANVQTGNFLIDGAIHGLGTLGGNAALGAGQAVGTAAEAGIQVLSGAAAHVVTPLVTGQALMGGADQAISSILTPEQIQANEALKAEAERQVKLLQSAVKSIKALASANPEQAEYLAGVFEKRYPELQGTIDNQLKALPAEGRMSGSAGELAGLKGQLEIANKQIQESEKRAAQLVEFLASVAEKIQRAQPQPDYIDVEVIDVETVQPKALPAASSASKQELQKNLDDAVAAIRAQIDMIGKTFSEQAKSIRPSENLLPEVRAQIAAAIESVVAEARAAIDETLAAFGDNIPKSVRTAAKSARQKITAAEKSAKSTLAEAQETGAEIPRGLNQGIESQLSALKETAKQMTDVVIAAAEAELEIKSPSRVFERIGRFVVEGFAKGLSVFGKPQEEMKNGLGTLVDAVEQGASDIKDDLMGLAEAAFDFAPPFLQAFGSIGTALLANASGVAKFTAAAAVIAPLFSQLSAGSIQAATALEQLSVQFESALGANGADALQAVTDRALAMRTDINQAREGYLQFGAAVRDTPLESLTDLASQSLSQAALVRGMSPEQADRARVAITQMISKGGPIQSEEVRGQLAEALPGSTAIFARALGMSQSEFSAQLTQGNISGADAVPKFLAQLQAETSSGVDASLNTTAASMTNLANQTQILQETLGKPLMPLQKMGIDALAAGLGLLNGVINELGQIITAVAVVSIGKFTVSMLANAGAAKLMKLGLVQLAGTSTVFNAMVGGASLLQAGMTGLIKVGAGLKAALLSPLALLSATLLAVVDNVRMVGRAFADSGGEARKFADSANRSFDEYAKKISAPPGTQQGFGRDTGESLLEGMIFGRAIDSVAGMFGFEGVSRGLERSIQGALKAGMTDVNTGELVEFDIPEWMPFIGGNTFSPGFTFGEKVAQDRFIARQDALQATNRLLSGDGETTGVYGLLEQARTGGGDLGRLASINRRMRYIQTDRNMLAPGDDDERQRLAEEERLLRAEQAQVEGRVRGLSGQLGGVIEGLKTLRDEAEKNKDTDAVEQYSRMIDDATKAQDKLNEAISVSVKSVAQLDAAFERIQGTLQENSRKIDITAANMRTMTASNAALTSGQREFAGFSIAQTELQARIQANKQAIAEMLELLREGETQRVLSQGGFTMESSPAAIREKAANMGDSVDKDRLISAATQIEGVQTLTAESANLTAQLAESQQQARQRLSDLTREINDFYRQISRDTQEMALSIEQTNIQTEFVRTKTKIEASLGRLRNTFFDDLISGVTDLAGILEEIALLPGQVQGEIAGVRNRMADTAQTAVQMHNQMPGGSQGGATGGMVGFSPYKTYRDHFIDDSPVGSYDYTLEQNGNLNPAIPSPVSGVVTETGYEKGYGNYVAVKDSATGMEHFFAHLHEVGVQAGQEVVQGMALGLQGTTGNSTGEHVHHEIYDRPRNEGGQQITDRSITRPIVEAYLANLERGQQTVQAPAPQPQAQPAAMPAAQAGSGNAVATTQAEAFQLAALAVLEAPSRQGRLDVVSNVFNRLNAPRAGLPSYGDSLTDVMFATGQYQPYFVDPNNPAAGTIDPARVSTMETAIGYLMQKREMSRGAAQEALNQVLADMANPQMMAESNRHVGGRLSFKGVQEYDNRVPSEDPLRQHGENFFHIDHNQTYDQLARVAALAPGAIIPGGAEGRPIQTMPHSGMAMSATGNPANAGLVNQGVAEFNNAANQQIAAMSDNQVARNDSLIQQAQNLLANQGQQLELNMREVDDTQIEAERRAREAEFDARIQTPEVQYEREIFALENRRVDLSRDLNVDKMERSLEALRKLEETYANLKVPPEVEQDRQRFLAMIREAIPATEQALAATQKAYAEESAAIEDIIKLKEEEFELAKERRQLEAQQQTTQMQSELTSREVQRARNRQYDFAGLRNAAGLEYSSGVADVEMETAIRRNDIEARLREATDNPELTAELQKQLQYLEEIRQIDLQNLEDQFNQTTDAVRMSNLEMDRRIFDSGQAVQQERASGLRALGLDYQAQGIEKQMAIGNVGMDLTETLAQIDQMQNSLGLAADQADALRQNAILLSEVRLDNINTQFSALGQLMPGIQGAFGNFFSQMIMGTTSVEDAFKGLLSSIAQQLADFAAKMLVQQLFGLILGKNGPGGAGGPMPAMQSPGGGGGIGDFVGVAQGLIGPLLGGLFGGGGAVAAAAPAAATGFGSTDFAGSFLNATNFTVGSGISFFDDGGIVSRGGGKLAKSIDDAMKREGANAQLIVASKGELILPVDKTREFYARGMDKILNFKEGGVIGRSTPMRGSSSSGAPSASVTVNVENKGRDMGKEDADKLGKDLEAAVMHTLMKSGKQGGFLYGYVKSNGNT